MLKEEVKITDVGGFIKTFYFKQDERLIRTYSDVNPDASHVLSRPMR